MDWLATSPGAVWITVAGTTGDTAELLELDPRTLTIRAAWGDTGQAMVVAGTTVWTAGSDLVGRNVTTGAIARRVALPPRSAFDYLAANAVGSTLLVATSDGEGHNPLISIDTATGAVTATRSFGDAAAGVIPASPIDGTVWIAIPGGHITVVARLDPTTLAPNPQCDDSMLNDPYCGAQQVLVGDGTLWEPSDGGAQCVGPISDRILGTVPGAVGDYLVDVGDSDVFAQDPNTGDVTATPIPAACQGT